MAYTEYLTVTRHEPTRLRRWLALARRSITLGPFNPKDRTIARYFGGEPSYAGVSVSAETALTYSPVWAAVNLIAGDLSGLPLMLYKRLDPAGKERYTAHPLYELIHDRPNPEMGSELFRETLQAHALIYGNGYAEIERGGPTGNQPVALWPLMPWQVDPIKEGNQPLYYRVLDPATNRHVNIRAIDMLHIRGLGTGVCGYDLIGKARQSLGLGIATERFGATFYANGTNVGGLLTTDKPLSPAARESLTKAVNSRHAGVENAHKFLLLEHGFKYEKFAIPANEAQFLETRQFQVEEVARWFNLPPYLLRRTEGTASYASTEQQRRDYYTTLYKWAKKWESELQAKLIFPAERHIQLIEHVWESFLAADTQARGAFYRSLFDMGAITPNEIRERENLNPVPGGNQAFVQLNLVPLDKAEEYAQKQIDAKAAPPAPEGSAEEVQEELDAERAAHVETKRQFATLQVASATLDARLAVSEEQRTKAEDALVEARGKVAELTADLASRSRDLESLEQAFANLTELRLKELERHDAVRAERDEALTRITSLEGDIQTITKEADTYREQRDQAQADIEGLRDALKTAAEQATRVEAKHDEAITRVQGLEETVRSLTADADTLRAELTNANNGSDLFKGLWEAEERGKLAATAERDEAFAARDRAIADAAEAVAAQNQAIEESIAAFEARDAAQVNAAREVEAAQEARTQATLAQAAKDAAEQALKAEKDAIAERLTALMGAHRALLVDAMTRFVAIEADKARSNDTTQAKLANWMRRFYPQHEQACADRLVPIVAAHLALVGSTADPVTVARELAQSHVRDSLADLQVIVECDPPEEAGPALEAVLTRWERHRPNALADRLTRDAVTAVRNL